MSEWNIWEAYRGMDSGNKDSRWRRLEFFKSCKLGINYTSSKQNIQSCNFHNYFDEFV